ncbi:MAG: hypothetical protein ACI8PT_000007 [Gammaproteobacteria bacterium]|jgi:hypothetical protein
MTLPSWSTASAFWPEFQTPSTNGLVRDIDAVLGQQFFNITQTQREPHAQPHRVRNDLRRNNQDEGRAAHVARTWGPNLLQRNRIDLRLTSIPRCANKSFISR